MEQIDGRALTASALEERRRIIIRMKESGYSEDEIVAATGCSRQAIYLLPYSPDLNPDEHINSDVKYGVGTKAPKKTKEGLRAATEEHIRMLRKAPERIVKYF